MWVRKLAFLCAWTLTLLLTVWSSAALYFDLPVQRLRAPASLLYLVLVTLAMFFFRRSHRGLMLAVAGFFVVALWWFSLTPSNDRDWRSDDVATAYAEISANGMLALLAVVCPLLDRQIARLERDFKEHGGFTERLYRVRTQHRAKQN